LRENDLWIERVVGDREENRGKRPGGNRWQGFVTEAKLTALGSQLL